MATGAGAAAVGVGAVPVGVGAVGAGAGVVAVSGSVLARCGLGHRDASRHTHEHRRRHNTRKSLHLKLQLVLPRDRNRQRNPTTLPMQLSVPALKTDMEEGPGWVKLRNTQTEHIFSGLPPTSDIARCSRHFAFVPLPDSYTVEGSDFFTSSARTSSAGGTVRPSGLRSGWERIDRRLWSSSFFAK